MTTALVRPGSLALRPMAEPASTVPPAPAGDAGATAAWLTRNAVDALPEGELARKLALGRPLRVKLGIDPTASDIHLGFTVVLGKLREFQDLGHTVVLIIGDYTARVGDPSGRSATRPVLSAEEIDANAATFQAQALTVLSPERLEVVRNSEWLDMPAHDLFALMRQATVAQLLERDDFAKRWAARAPISVLELLYPLLQGYDSVAVRADVELGGSDQKFNLLLGAGHPARLRGARAGDPDPAAADRHRRDAKDVEVLRQLHRRHRRAGRDVRPDAEHPRQRRFATGTGCCSTANRRPGSPRAMPSGRWPAHS